jgi:hypothetical protein
MQGSGWGSVTHCNGFVANLEMQGRGVFYDPRLNDATTFPVAGARLHRTAFRKRRSCSRIVKEN